MLRPLDDGRTRSVGAVEYGEKEQKKKAENFVKKMQREKAERERMHKMQMEAKDQAFLTKLRVTLDNRQKVEEMKNREKEMRHHMMMKKLDQKQQPKRFEPGPPKVQNIANA